MRDFKIRESLIKTKINVYLVKNQTQGRVIKSLFLFKNFVIIGI